MSNLKEQFLHGMSKAASSVYIVTTNGLAGKRGITVSAVSSVSADPIPTLLICLHKNAPAAEVVRINGVFCVNLLSNTQSEVSDVFAGRSDAQGEDKFSVGQWGDGATGCPVLQGTLASFDCKVVHNILSGSHHIFVGESQQVEVSDHEGALLYANRAYSEAHPINSVASDS